MDKKKSKLVGIVDESNNVVGQRDILLDRVDEFGRMVCFLNMLIQYCFAENLLKFPC